MRPSNCLKNSYIWIFAAKNIDNTVSNADGLRILLTTMTGQAKGGPSTKLAMICNQTNPSTIIKRGKSLETSIISTAADTHQVS